jgi:hypothetical protein
MNVNAIKKAMAARPFRPIELRLQDGDRIVIRHPENVWVSPDWVVTLDEENRTVFINPDGLVSIRRLKIARKR